MRECIDEDDAIRYQNQTLSSEGQRAIEEHIAVCSSCLELVLALKSGRRCDTLEPARKACGLPRAEKIGNYSILEELGSGAMGIVYAAYDLELERRVALKLVRRPGPAASERIRREAQALARLSHPSIVAVYGVHPLPDDEIVVAMEYVPGKNLREWLTERPRMDWATIRKVFVQAAAGLASAHEAGLVHRDFKPENLLITEDVEAKVIDFGLVRSADETERSLEHSLASASSPFNLLTEEGAVIGTPAYMAPEHLEDGTINARTDQFAFCVTLFEVIYGERPFLASSYQELRERLLDRPLELPDRPRDVPRSVEALLRRGLSKDPDQRFASMRDLMVGLEGATARSPKYRNLTLGAVGAATLLVGALVTQRPPRCPTPTRAFSSIWEPPIKAHLRERITATGLSYAEDVWLRIRPRLDAFVSSWQRMHTESCQATLLRHEQTAHVHALRELCLQEEKEQFRSIVDLFGAATPNVVDRAAELAAGLSLERCRNAKALLAVPPPENAEIAEAVADIRDRLVRLEVKHDAAAYDEGLDDSGVALRRAEASGYPAVVAEALYWQGVFLHRTHDYEKSAQTLERAYSVAIEANHLELAADASRELTWVVGYFLAKADLGFQWSVSARALARLREAGGLREADSLGRLGKLEAFAGKSRDAETHLRAAEAMYRRHLDDTHPKLGAVVMDLGTSFFGEGRYQEALVHYRRALEIQRQTFGPRHVRVASAYLNVGIALMNLNAWGEAEQSLELARDIYTRSGRGPTYEEGMLFYNLGQLAKRLGKASVAAGRYSRSLIILQEKLGADHPRTSLPLRGLGEVSLSEGRVTQAVKYLERALKVASAEGHDPGYRANVEFSLARACHQARDRARARELAVAALDRYRKRGLSREEERVTTWLVEHGY